MKILRSKEHNGLPGKKGDPRPVQREHADSIRKLAEELSKVTDKSDGYITGDDIARRQQEEIEQRMAQLRSEAVAARDLAQHIDNLSQEVAALKRKGVMTDSTRVDPKQAASSQRRAGEKPRAAEKLSSFNPLHPSMELPPEQLIRLLGLETKKIRKNRKKTTAQQPPPAKPPAPELEDFAAPAPPAPAKAATESRAPVDPDPVPASQPAHRVSRDRLDTDVFDSGGSGNRLWIVALGAGLLAGSALSAFLFWPEDEAGTPQAQSAPVPTPVPKVAAPTARPTTPVPDRAAKPVAAKPVSKDPLWNATVDAQENRLLDQAEQRFKTRLRNTPGPVAVPAPAAATDAGGANPNQTIAAPASLPERSATPDAPTETAPPAAQAPVDDTPAPAASGMIDRAAAPAVPDTAEPFVEPPPTRTAAETPARPNEQPAPQPAPIPDPVGGDSPVAPETLSAPPLPAEAEPVAEAVATPEAAGLDETTRPPGADTLAPLTPEGVGGSAPAIETPAAGSLPAPASQGDFQ